MKDVAIDILVYTSIVKCYFKLCEDKKYIIKWSIFCSRPNILNGICFIKKKLGCQWLPRPI